MGVRPRRIGPDGDDDDVPDFVDNCPTDPNFLQSDLDGETIGDEAGSAHP